MDVLVLTDFSNDAYNALFYATKLFKNNDCHFHILHTYTKHSHLKNEFAAFKGNKSLRQFLDDRTKESLTATRHKIIADSEKNGNHQFSTCQIYDSLLRGVKSYLKQNKVDLIVMGNKGRTGAREIFFGGNTIQMVKSKCAVPILCVPKEIEYSAISKLGFISGFEPSLTTPEMQLLKSIAHMNSVALHIIYVYSDKRELMELGEFKYKLGLFFDGITLEFHDLKRSKSIAKTVADYVKSHQIDLLAMTYYPHYFLTKLFREPVVMDLNIYMENPFLVLPGQE